MRSHDDIAAIRAQVEARLAALGRKVRVVVNYDHFKVAAELLDAYGDMVRELTGRFYLDVTRYTTSAFLRAKLGRALRRRHLAPHIFESAEEALDYYKTAG